EIKHISELILDYLNKDDSKVEYKKAEPFTTRVKNIDSSKAIKDLGHDPRTSPEEGIPKTIEWMKSIYGLEGK
ncbi:NAD(P)-dependent oxidoreductase, partial [Patescibacteria group bacterium]|nr:NAD(P)-dependent oxidoreductase [Patescibacteria group bacterium]